MIWWGQSRLDSDPPKRSLIRAVVLAPLAAPVSYAAVLLGVEFGRAVLGYASGPSIRSVGYVVGAVAAIGTPLAYAAMLLGGLPIYLALRRVGVLSRWTLWAGGTAIGVIVALLLAPSLRGDLFSIPFPWWLGALAGVLSAETFWRLLSRSVPKTDVDAMSISSPVDRR
jgi:hypothetical protein